MTTKRRKATAKQERPKLTTKETQNSDRISAETKKMQSDNKETKLLQKEAKKSKRHKITTKTKETKIPGGNMYAKEIC